MNDFISNSSDHTLKTCFQFVMILKNTGLINISLFSDIIH